MADATAESDFSTKTWCEDLTLIVEDRKVYVNKAVLALASPMFKAMFTEKFRDKDTAEITLPDKKHEDMVEFLRCIYPNILKPITLDNVYTVLPLASEYQVQSMKSACETCLPNHLSNTKKKNTKYTILRLACLYDLEEAKERCIEMIADQPYQEFDEAAKKTKFPDDIQMKIKSMSLHALDAKYNDLMSRYKTSEVLLRYLGDLSNRQDLVVKNLDGYVFGNYVNLKLYSDFKTKTQIKVGNLLFSITVNTIRLNADYAVVVDTEVETYTKCDKSGLLGVVIHNWMTSCKDFRQEVPVIFGNNMYMQSSPRNFKFQLKKNVRELTEETAGFICKGKIDCTMYLLINKI